VYTEIAGFQTISEKRSPLPLARRRSRVGSTASTGGSLSIGGTPPALNTYHLKAKQNKKRSKKIKKQEKRFQ
jgi:hypothetical protein